MASWQCMLRRMLWIAFSLFPIVSFVAVIAASRTPPADWPVWGALLAVGVPVAIVEGMKAEWWFGFVLVWVAHYGFFVLHPFFNGAVSDMKRKAAWSALTLMFYPFVPPIYAWLCTGAAGKD